MDAVATLACRRYTGTRRIADDSLVLPYLGDLELRQITPERLDNWVQELVDLGKAATTTRKAFQLASSVLSRAVTLRKLPANPAKVGEGIHLPKVAQKETRFLTVDEVGGLAAAVNGRYRALVLTAAFTGLRWGELAALRRKRLDLNQRRLTVAEALSDVRGVTSFKAPKSPASKRTVAIPAALAGELAGHLDHSPAVGDGLVFASAEGRPLRRSNFRRRVWLPAVAEVLGGPCRFHDLRHTHAAWLIEQGEHAKTIQSRLGHASISTTLDRYGHLMPGMDKAAADRLGEAFFKRVMHPGSTPEEPNVVNLG